MEIFCPPGCLSGSLGQDSTMPRICSGLRKDNRATITHWKTYFWILRSCRHPDHSAIALYYTTERFGASGVLLSLNFWSSASIFSSSGKGDHFWPAEGARQRGCSGLEKVKAIRWLLSCQKKQPAPSSSSSWLPPPSSGLASLLATVWPATSPTAPRRSLPWRRLHL